MPLPARLLVAALAGAATAAAFEPFTLPYLLPVSVAALALACRGTTPGRGFLVGSVFGTAFMLLLLPWLQVIGTAAWVALSVVEGLFYGLLGLATAAVSRFRAWPVLAAAAWTGVEALRGLVPFGGFPWGRLAFATVDTPVAPLMAYVGAAGVTFVVALIGNALAWAVLTYRHMPVRAASGVVLPVLLVGGLGAVPVNDPSPGTGQPAVSVAAVQGNVPGRGLEAFAERRAVLDNHVSATEDLAARIDAGEVARPDVLVWPENSSDIDPYADPTARSAIAGAVRSVGAPLLMGTVVGDRPQGGWRNRAIVWSPDGEPGAHYDKIHPVPFGEYIPLRSLLAPRVPALDQIPNDMVPGTRTGVLEVGPTRLGALMCFEVAYDGLLRDLVDEGAQVVVVPTNNATYTGTGQIQQQFAISRLRAIETGRFVVVAATNGVSGIVAPDGRVIAKAPVSTQRVLQAAVTPSDRVTLAVRSGAWLELAVALSGLAGVVCGILLGRRDRRRSAGDSPAPVPVEAQATSMETGRA
jgi:apolipoprotein N-acyltransferase